MNKKGEVNNIVYFVLAVVLVVLGVALIQPVGNTVAQGTTTGVGNNYTVTGSATANGTVNLIGRDSGVLNQVVNASGSTVTSQFSIVNTLDNSNTLRVQLKTLDTAVTAKNNGSSVNVTYTYNPDGYDSNSASRGIQGIIVLFMAFGLALAVIKWDTLKEIMDF